MKRISFFLEILMLYEVYRFNQNKPSGVQGVQRIYGRFCNYKAINQKVNIQALKFLTF